MKKNIIKHFFVACIIETDVNIIQNIINEYKIDVNKSNYYGYNAIFLACEYNTNLNIIKYLIDDLHININHKHISGACAFTLACCNNTNLEIIKFLVNKCHIGIYEYKFGDAFLLACRSNTNLNIVKFLINECRIDINYKNVYYQNVFYIANKNVKKYFINSGNVIFLNNEYIDKLNKQQIKLKNMVNLL